MKKHDSSELVFLRSRAEQLYDEGMLEEARRLLTRMDDAQVALFAAQEPPKPQHTSTPPTRHRRAVR